MLALYQNFDYSFTKHPHNKSYFSKGLDGIFLQGFVIKIWLQDYNK